MCIRDRLGAVSSAALEYNCAKSTSKNRSSAKTEQEAQILLLQLERRAFGRIGQEQEALVFLLKPVHEFGHTVQQAVAVIDDTVHIAYKALFLSLIHISSASSFRS